MSNTGIGSVVSLDKTWLSGKNVSDAIWKGVLNNNQMLSSPALIDEANRKHTETMPSIYEIIKGGKIPRVIKSKPRLFPRISTGGDLSPTGSLPDVKIFNRGTTADFTIGLNKVSFDKKTGTITLSNQVGDSLKFSSRDDLPYNLKSKFAAGNQVSIDIDDNGLRLRLYPAADGRRIKRAEVVWSGNKKLSTREQMQAIFRARIENKINIDNISGGDYLKITSEQNYIERNNMVFLKTSKPI